jgi:hypothetical protein
LFTKSEAELLGAAHAPILADLGYSCDFDADLGALEADANWIRLAWSGLVDDLQNMRIVKREASNSQLALRATSKELLDLKQTHHELWMESKALRAELEKAQAFIAQCDGLGPQSIQLARQLKGFGERHPRIFAMLKAFISPV